GFEPLEQQIEGHDLGERSRMARFVCLVGMQHVAGIRVEHNRRIGRGGAGFMFAVPRLMRPLGEMTRSMARGGCRAGSEHNGESGGKTGVSTQPLARAWMSCFQLQVSSLSIRQ